MTSGGKQHGPQESWQPCQSGEIAGLVKGLRSRRSRQTAHRALVGVVAFGVLLVAGLYAVPRLGGVERDYGGITCSEVVAHADDYIAGTLEPAVAGKIDVHLAQCDHCRRAIRQRRRRKDSAPLAVKAGHVAVGRFLSAVISSERRAGTLAFAGR